MIYNLSTLVSTIRFQGTNYHAYTLCERRKHLVQISNYWSGNHNLSCQGNMERMRTWRAYLTGRFAADQEAAIRYLKYSLEEYQIDGDTPLLLLALQTVVESQGGIFRTCQENRNRPRIPLRYSVPATKHRELTRSLPSSTHLDVGSRLNP